MAFSAEQKKHAKNEKNKKTLKLLLGIPKDGLYQILDDLKHFPGSLKEKNSFF